jgi:hypothetical protein
MLRPPEVLIVGGRVVKRKREARQSDADYEADRLVLFDELARLQYGGFDNTIALTRIRIRFMSWLDVAEIQSSLEDRSLQDAAAAVAASTAAADAAAAAAAAESADGATQALPPAPPLVKTPSIPVYVPVRPTRTNLFPHSVQVKRGKLEIAIEVLRRFDIEFKMDFGSQYSTLLGCIGPMINSIEMEIDIVFASTSTRPRVDAANLDASHFKIATRSQDETDVYGRTQSCIFDSDAKTRKATVDPSGKLVFRSLYFLEDMITTNLKSRQDYQFRVAPVHPSLKQYGWLVAYSPPFKVMVRCSRGVREERKMAAAAAAAGPSTTSTAASVAAGIVAVAQVEQPQ